MPRVSPTFLRLGYEVWSVPGISRAWRREFADGSYLLITDVGGYDLPEIGGPYAGMYLSARDELIECVPWVLSTRKLFGWVRHTERLAVVNSATQAETSLQVIHYDLFTN